MDIENNIERVNTRSARRAERKVNRIAFFIIKQTFDSLLSLLLILLLLPVFIIISLILYKKEGSPILMREVKVGKEGQLFKLYTFRTLSNRSKVIRAFPPHPFPRSWEYGVPNEFVYNMDDYSIVTETGSWLMKYKLHKLPHLINVIKGHMSFIGPEPENEDIAAYYNERQKKRLEIKPGIISYSDKKSGIVYGYDNKVNDDLYYIRKCSFRMDIKLMLQTLIKQNRNNK